MAIVHPAHTRSPRHSNGALSSGRWAYPAAGSERCRGPHRSRFDGNGKSRTAPAGSRRKIRRWGADFGSPSQPKLLSLLSVAGAAKIASIGRLWGRAWGGVGWDAECNKQQRGGLIGLDENGRFKGLSGGSLAKCQDTCICLQRNDKFLLLCTAKRLVLVAGRCC